MTSMYHVRIIYIVVVTVVGQNDIVHLALSRTPGKIIFASGSPTEQIQARLSMCSLRLHMLLQWRSCPAKYGKIAKTNT